MTERRDIDLGGDQDTPAFTKTEFWLIQLRLSAYTGYSWFVSDNHNTAKAIYNSYKSDGWYRWHRPLGLGFYTLVDTLPQTPDSALYLSQSICGQGRDLILYTGADYDFPAAGDDDSLMEGDHPVTLHVSLFDKSDLEQRCVFAKTSLWGRAPSVGGHPRDRKMYISPWLAHPGRDLEVSETAGGGYYCWMTLCKPVSSTTEQWVHRHARLRNAVAAMCVMKAERWECLSAPDDIMEWYDKIPPVYSNCWDIPSPLDDMIAAAKRNIP